MTEEWKPIVGYEGYYEVSNHGNVRGCERWVDGCRGGGLRLRKQRPLRHNLSDQGYLIVRLSKHRIGKTYAVHRLVAAAFLGPRPEGQEIRHLDGSRINARLDNLAYGTRTENVADSKRHGTFVCGEKSFHARLTTEDIVEIRASKGKKSGREIATKYGLSRNYVYEIQRGTAWPHIPLVRN